MKISGKTPLVRLINLEKLLKVKRIYLKMEGANPTNHKYARIAEVLCKDAIAHHQKVIWVDGSQAYVTAMKYFADMENLQVRVPRFKHESWKKKICNELELIDMRALDHKNHYEILRALVEKNHEYLAIEGYTHKHIFLMTLEEITEEIIGRLKQIDTIYTQSSFGYTLNSMYNVFLKDWVHNENRFPKIYCGIHQENQHIENTQFNDSTTYIQNNKELLEISKKAIEESYGSEITISDEELKHAKNLLRNSEQIYMSKENAYPMAAFLKQVKEQNLENGIHVIVLDDARSKATIRQIDDLSGDGFDRVLGYVKTYLAEYSDPKIEIADAIKNATEKGYILLAEQNDENLGVCIIVNTQFEDFIPTYHLAYIGTINTSKGRGIGTELIKQAIDKTNGNLSLHVDLDNKNAKKLYEKMGFKHTYNRMLYYSE